MQDEAVVRSIIEAIGWDASSTQIARVGDGFASVAWSAEPADGMRVAVRVAAAGLGPADVTYEMEHALMTRLDAIGAAVPRPVLGSWQVTGWHGSPWSVTSWAPGHHPTAEAAPRSVPAIRDFLAALRSVPVEGGGFGALTVDTDGTLRGAASTIDEGLVAWAGRPFWPLDGTRLVDHPAIGDVPALVAGMEARAMEVRAALRAGPTGVLHSDLHDENLLEADDGSLTFIDFGEALVGPLAWDMAAIAFFMDWSIAADVAEDDPEVLLAAARIGLAFGAYRWHLSREHAFEDDDHDRAYLEACLARLS